MENPTQLQLLQAVVFFSAGIAVGVVYDICTAVRRCSGQLLQATAEILFTCTAAWLLFVLGMLVGGGQLRIFMIGCTMLGMAGYRRICSKTVVSVLCKGIRGLKKLTRIPLRMLKNFIKLIKNLFPKRYVWSKMNGYSLNMRQFVFKHTRGREASENNHETDRMDGLHRDRCNGGVCRVEYSSGPISSDQSGGIPRGTDGTDRTAGSGK